MKPEAGRRRSEVGCRQSGKGSAELRRQCVLGHQGNQVNGQDDAALVLEHIGGVCVEHGQLIQVYPNATFASPTFEVAFLAAFAKASLASRCRSRCRRRYSEETRD